MSLKQTKHLYRELAYQITFRFISNFKNIRKPELVNAVIKDVKFVKII